MALIEWMPLIEGGGTVVLSGLTVWLVVHGIPAMIEANQRHQAKESAKYRMVINQLTRSLDLNAAASFATSRMLLAHDLHMRGFDPDDDLKLDSCRQALTMYHDLSEALKVWEDICREAAQEAINVE